MSIVSLTEHRARNSPHIAGKAICLQCKHEFIGVAKADPGASFDCPECSTGLAIFKYPTYPPEGTEVFECGDCESTVFMVVRAGLHCWRCGSVRPFPT